MPRTLTIAPRFCGPPDSGNGGYVCGWLADEIPGVAEVTLQSPPPLSTPLVTERQDNGSVVLRHGATAVAAARAATLEIDVPAPPSFEEAAAATKGQVPREQHPFPGCFVCGPDRDPGDGLCITPGPPEKSEHPGLVAAPWVPDASLCDDTGRVAPEFVWAALDCAGAIAEMPNADHPILLGRFTAELLGELRPGERCVSIGWPLSREGRKHFAGTAIFSEAGELVCRAKACWIELVPKTTA